MRSSVLINLVGQIQMAPRQSGNSIRVLLSPTHAGLLLNDKRFPLIFSLPHCPPPPTDSSHFKVFSWSLSIHQPGSDWCCVSQSCCASRLHWVLQLGMKNVNVECKGSWSRWGFSRASCGTDTNFGAGASCHSASCHTYMTEKLLRSAWKQMLPKKNTTSASTHNVRLKDLCLCVPWEMCAWRDHPEKVWKKISLMSTGGIVWLQKENS